MREKCDFLNILCYFRVCEEKLVNHEVKESRGDLVNLEVKESRRDLVNLEVKESRGEAGEPRGEGEQDGGL